MLQILRTTLGCTCASCLTCFLPSILKNSVLVSITFNSTLCNPEKDKHQEWPEVQLWPYDPSYITATRPYPCKHTNTQKMVPESEPVLESRVAEKAALYPSDYSREKTPPTILFYSDNRPVVGRRAQTKTTLSLPSCSPYCIQALISSTVGQQVSLTQRYLNHSLCLSFLLSLHPQLHSSLYCLHNPEADLAD